LCFWVRDISSRIGNIKEFPNEEIKEAVVKEKWMAK
jgi:hypothetical protein